MKKKMYHITGNGVILAIIAFLFLPAIQARDPGFFLDDWQEKSAEIPEFELTDTSWSVYAKD